MGPRAYPGGRDRGRRRVAGPGGETRTAAGEAARPVMPSGPPRDPGRAACAPLRRHATPGDASEGRYCGVTSIVNSLPSRLNVPAPHCNSLPEASKVQPYIVPDTLPPVVSRAVA